MKAQSQDALREFEKLLHELPLLTKVGTLPVDVEGRCKSWDEVYKYIGKQNKWLNFKNSITNTIDDIAFEFFYEEQEVYSAIDKVTKHYVQETLADFNFPRIFKDSPESAQVEYHVIWDLGMVAVEKLLSAKKQNFPKFFTDLVLPWYQKGHFPCGWDGKMIAQSWEGKSLADLPEGTVRVF